MGVEVKVEDHSDEVLAALDQAVEAALEAVGIQCEGYAQDILTAGLPRAGSWSGTSGALKQSINHKVVLSEKAVYVGSNNDHAVYNELGTGAFAESGGRQGWWVYVPGGGKSGTNTGKVYTEEKARQVVAILKSKGLDAHMTMGMKPLHFIKKAATEHIDEYKQIVIQQLKK